MSVTFNNRVPGTKTSVALDITGFTQSEKVVVLIGHATEAGGNVDPGVVTTILNFGDPVKAKTECDTYFGSGSELGEMVVAAINAVVYTDMGSKVFPKIKVIALEFEDDDLESLLGDIISVPMPHVASPFPITDATNLASLKLHLEAISGHNRGKNGQFGSFGYIASQDEFAVASPLAIASGTQYLAFPWQRDTDATKANKVHEIAAATAILMAANPVPYNPVNEVRIGKLNAPTLSSDYHTSGDTGTEALGLDSGLMPILTNDAGEALISRSITSLRTESEAIDSAYYDIQDWQVLYEFRFNAYLASLKPPFKNKKLSDQKLLDFKSELLSLAYEFEELEMFQHVKKQADQFIARKEAGNRHAGIVATPVNVVPGFHQKGIDITGNNTFDTITL